MVKRALAFFVTLMAAVAAFEAFAARRIAALDPGLIGVEIYDVLARAAAPGPLVERIYVGDSVARQFFPPGGEPNARVRFLTANATISIAGDYYLIEDAFRHNPNARDVVLVARPENLQVNLDTPANQDYFSTFFHRPGAIRELWRVKRDPKLALSQATHWALPGVMATNSMWRQNPRALAPRPSVRVRSVIIEPTIVAVSPVAAHFLPRIQALVAARGGTFRIISVPLPVSEPWADPSRILSDAIMYLSRDAFGDGVHLGPYGMKSCAGTDIARRFAEAHGLVEDLPAAQVPASERCEDPQRPFHRGQR